MDVAGKCLEAIKAADMDTKIIQENGTGPVAGTQWNIPNVQGIIPVIISSLYK